jgi:magnesium-protoporphyrin O-methyltransferase
VSCSCGDFSSAADRQFTALKAAKELKAYRRGRLGPTTRRLRDGLAEAGLTHGTLLDIGGGVGALTFELLDRGITGATVLEASSAYASAAQDEATRRARAAAVNVVHGDLVEVSSDLPSADVVTLDRVVCCYPSYEPLLDQALRHATQGFGLSYPRDRWYVRAVMWFDNAKRARGSGFRTFVHPPREMQRIIERAGFLLVRRRQTAAWTIDVFRKRREDATRQRTRQPGSVSI